MKSCLSNPPSETALYRGIQIRRARGLQFFFAQTFLGLRGLGGVFSIGLNVWFQTVVRTIEMADLGWQTDIP